MERNICNKKIKFDALNIILGFNNFYFKFTIFIIFLLTFIAI